MPGNAILTASNCEAMFGNNELMKNIKEINLKCDKMGNKQFYCSGVHCNSGTLQQCYAMLDQF